MPREDFEAAIADLQANDGQRQEPEPSAIGGEEHDFREAPAAPAAPATPVASPPAIERDPTGKFAPRAAAKEQIPADSQPEQQAQIGTPAPKPGVTRAPQSWKPEEREGWDKLDPRHQAAISRRELEMQQALSSTDEARRFHNEVQRILQPYDAFIRAENATPFQAIESLFQTAAALRTAPPGHKAQLVADMIMQFGVDVSTLDQALTARMRGNQGGVAHPMDPIMRALDQKLAPLQQFVNQQQQTRQQAEAQMRQSSEQQWQTFADAPENEFAWDLKDDIADILEMAAKRNQQLTLQDAYARATLLHPTISTIVQRRTQTNGAAQQTAAARRALEAAVSIPSSGGAPSRGDEDEGDGTLRSDLMSSVRALQSKSR